MSMQVPFFEYPRLWSDNREELLSIIDNVSSSGGFILQKAVSDFELQLANYAGSNYAVGVGNATDGMEIFLDTPWDVEQPQGEPWNPELDEKDALKWVENTFKDKPGFVLKEESTKEFVNR